MFAGPLGYNYHPLPTWGVEMGYPKSSNPSACCNACSPAHVQPESGSTSRPKDETPWRFDKCFGGQTHSSEVSQQCCQDIQPAKLQRWHDFSAFVIHPEWRRFGTPRKKCCCLVLCHFGVHKKSWYTETRNLRRGDESQALPSLRVFVVPFRGLFWRLNIWQRRWPGLKTGPS